MATAWRRAAGENALRRAAVWRQHQHGGSGKTGILAAAYRRSDASSQRKRWRSGNGGGWRDGSVQTAWHEQRRHRQRQPAGGKMAPSYRNGISGVDRQRRQQLQRHRRRGVGAAWCVFAVVCVAARRRCGVRRSARCVRSIMRHFIWRTLASRHRTAATRAGLRCFRAGALCYCREHRASFRGSGAHMASPAAA